ncbi:MAG: DUF177 domain-containing protein [Bacteroidales bacterium]|nr:DUF177 domain-containing protein [Bacteroidales bacterium]
MERDNQYIIPLDGLAEKEYTFAFKADDAFFQSHEGGEIKGGEVDVKVTLLKKKTSMLMNFDLSGTVKLTCDRCLELYNQPIEISDEILVNYGDETNFDTNSDAVTLSRDANSINVSSFIYEYSHFALPIAHYHPEDADGNPTCDPKMIDLIDKYKVEETEKTEDAIDPRWEALRELKNNNN